MGRPSERAQIEATGAAAPRRRPVLGSAGVALLAALLVAGPGQPASAEASKTAAAKRAAAQADTREALARLRSMLDHLNGLTRFAFVAHTGHDAVQRTGQRLEFGARRRFLVRRPDRMRIESKDRSGAFAELFFDGQRISVALPDEKAYASVAKSGGLDEAIDYLERNLDEPVPLLNLVHTGLYEEIAERIRYGFVVGEETIGDRLCDHLAFQAEELDFQLWIEKGGRPLPFRLVIDYKQEPGRPQFWAQWTQWDLVPDASSELFVFRPPEGAEQIPFAPARSNTGVGSGAR